MAVYANNAIDTNGWSKLYGGRKRSLYVRVFSLLWTLEWIALGNGHSTNSTCFLKKKCFKGKRKAHPFPKKKGFWFLLSRKSEKQKWTRKMYTKVGHPIRLLRPLYVPQQLDTKKEGKRMRKKKTDQNIKDDDNRERKQKEEHFA